MRENLFVATFSQEAIKIIQQYQLGMEINHTCISHALDYENREVLLGSIQKDISNANISISDTSRLICHGPFTEIHPAAIDDKAQELAMFRLNQAFEVCQSLGIHRMVVHSGWLPFVYFKSWQVEKSTAFWQRFLKDKPDNFCVYIENVLEDEPYMLKDLMERLNNPRIGLCLDIGHANAMTKECPVAQWIEVLGPYLKHFHLHDNDGTKDSHLAFGQGTMNIHEILASIKNHCPSATLTLEASNARACLEWLSKEGYL